MINKPRVVESGTELNGSIAAKKICLLVIVEVFSSLCFTDVGVAGPCLNSGNISLLMVWIQVVPQKNLFHGCKTIDTMAATMLTPLRDGGGWNSKTMDIVQHLIFFLNYLF